MKKYMAIAGLVLVTVIWGGGFVASDMALDSLSPFQIMTIRFLLASVLMGGDCSFYCFSDLPEKSRIQRYNRSSAGHRGGGTFVPG